jgi:hypothetical protein
MQPDLPACLCGFSHGLVVGEDVSFHQNEGPNIASFAYANVWLGGLVFENNSAANGAILRVDSTTFTVNDTRFTRNVARYVVLTAVPALRECHRAGVNCATLS